MRPELPAHLSFLWGAFWALNTDRPMSVSGAGAIGFSSVDRYADRYGIDDLDDFEAFADAIGAMDDVFLEWQAQRRKADPQSNK